MMSKNLACEHVAEVHLDERHVDGQKGVAQGDAGMRISRRIHDDEGDALVFRSVNLRDQFVLRIALEDGQGMTAGAGEFPELGLDALQAGGAVNLRLAEPEKIQVRTV